MAIDLARMCVAPILGAWLSLSLCDAVQNLLQTEWWLWHSIGVGVCARRRCEEGGGVARSIEAFEVWHLATLLSAPRRAALPRRHLGESRHLVLCVVHELRERRQRLRKGVANSSARVRRLARAARPIRTSSRSPCAALCAVSSLGLPECGLEESREKSKSGSWVSSSASLRAAARGVGDGSGGLT